MPDDRHIRFVPKTAFVMPLLPEDLKVDPLLAGLLHCMAFLELSGDEAVDPDWAVEAMEHVAAYLQRLQPDERRAVSGQLARISEHARREGAAEAFADFADNLLSHCGVEGTADEA